MANHKIIVVTRMSTKMLRKLYIGFLMILILHTALGSFIEYSDVARSMEDYEGSKSVSIEEDAHVDSLQLDSHENTMYDIEYPSEQLERIVEETMELLQSDDEEKKRKLKISPSDHWKYRRISYIPAPDGVKSGRKLWDENDYDGGCPVIIQEDMPIKLPDISGKDNWILNVNNMKQTVLRRICAKKISCGEEHKNPFGYKLECKQIFKKYPLFSIPVDQELVKENQVFREYSFPSNCVCKLKRIK